MSTAENQHTDGDGGGGLLVLSLAAGAFSLAQTSIVPGLGVLSHELNASVADIGWVLTGYLISAAILTPVFGRLGDMLGKRRMLLIALALFTAGSVVGALAPNVWVLVAARIIQGAGGGIFPLCYGIIGDNFAPHRRPAALGLISALAGIGAGAGLLAGGLLIDHLSWEWIFWVGALMSGLAILGAFRLPESTVLSPGRIDVPGVAVLSVGLTAPLLALSRTATWGWSDARTLGLFAAGAVFLVGFVFLELRVPTPLVDMRVLGSPVVLITNIAMLLFGAGMFAVFSLVPQLAQLPEAVGYGFGLGATGSALLLLPGALLMLVAAVIVGRIVLQVGPKAPLIAGSLIAALGLACLALVHGSQLTVVLFASLTFIGIGVGMAAMPNIIMAAVPPDRISEGTGVNALVRTVGSSIGSQVVATVLAGSVVAGSAVATDSAFSMSFWLAAGAVLLAAAVAVFIPKLNAVSRTPVEVREIEAVRATAPAE
jgi:EmrB/QacA subfamily drug resistance transporter